MQMVLLQFQFPTLVYQSVVRPLLLQRLNMNKRAITSSRHVAPPRSFPCGSGPDHAFGLQWHGTCCGNTQRSIHRLQPKSVTTDGKTHLSYSSGWSSATNVRLSSFLFVIIGFGRSTLALLRLNRRGRDEVSLRTGLLVIQGVRNTPTKTRQIKQGVVHKQCSNAFNTLESIKKLLYIVLRHPTKYVSVAFYKVPLGFDNTELHCLTKIRWRRRKSKHKMECHFHHLVCYFSIRTP